MSSFPALLLAATIPAVSVIASVIRHRRVDALGLVVVITALLSVGASLIAGSPRFLLVKDGWLTGMWGLWFLVSLRTRRPATYLCSRPLFQGRRIFDPGKRAWVASTTESWDSIWERSPTFRRIWRVTTIIWGMALLIDAVIRVVMAYTLPINVVPGLGGALWPVTFIVLQVITNVYFFRSGFWMILSRDVDGAKHEENSGAAGPTSLADLQSGERSRFLTT